VAETASRAERKSAKLVAVAWALHVAVFAFFLHGGPFVVADVAALALLAALGVSVIAGAGVARSRALRIAVAAAVSTFLVIEGITFRYFHKSVDVQLVASMRHNWADVRPALVAGLPFALAMFTVACALEWAWLGLAQPLGRPRARVGAIALAFAAAAVIVAGRSSGAPAPATIAAAATANAPFSSSSAFLGVTKKPPATTLVIPELAADSPRAPNVLLVLLESVRFDSYCKDTSSPCDVAPKTAELLRGGVSFVQARSIASYTAVSFDALVTGQPQNGPKDVLQAMPTIFEYLHHATISGRRVSVGYFSSQSESVFERTSARQSIDRQCTVETLVGHSVDDEDAVLDLGVDRVLADRVEKDLPQLQPPYFAFVHVSGTHAPYFVDDKKAPKKPYVRYASWSKLKELQNAYDDAIFTQDETVARMIAAFARAQNGGPWLMFLTSDHGEAFGEHSAIHHGQSLYDEQIHVPLFVVWGGGALDDAHASTVRENAQAFVTELDLLPTILDAFGLWTRARDAGVDATGASLLGTLPSAREPIPVTNCTAMFPCPMNTWGLLAPGRALVAQPWDYGFHCVDLTSERDLADDPACADLSVRSRGIFPTLPYGGPNR
jgi:glucan phosphoethanolaminetransferase (alkaline phosphatase superfamily)